MNDSNEQQDILQEYLELKNKIEKLEPIHNAITALSTILDGNTADIADVDVRGLTWIIMKIQIDMDEALCP
jgi:hypothetical protein